jgi:hypothetical protein
MAKAAQRKAPTKKKAAVSKKAATRQTGPKTAAEEFSEEMGVQEPVEEEVEEELEEELEDDDDLDLDAPGDVIPIDGSDPEDVDESLLVESFETNCVYQSKVKPPGERFYLIKESHFDPQMMVWVNRDNRKHRSRRKFKQRATRGTFRDAMQELATGGGGDSRDEPLS